MRHTIELTVNAHEHTREQRTATMTLVERFGLDGKAALVVGGGYGIGRETSLLLAEAGARVAVADIDPERAASVADEVNGVAIVGDVTTADGARQVVDDAYSQLGGLDRVANIVGIATFVEDVFAIDLDIWEHDIRMNLAHHLYVCRAAARHMIDDGTGGAFALVASVSGFYGAARHAAYGAAKAGLMSLSRAMASEWGPHGIRVNCVAPDVILTPRLFPEGSDTPPIGGEVVLGRWGRPTDIAGPLVFLLSELSSFMTGRTLVVDGGSMIHFPHGLAQQPSP
jgi:NAD(P)-dependent dehydrogenase (short-subunit alcohol dehydrogenase family)